MNKVVSLNLNTRSVISILAMHDVEYRDTAGLCGQRFLTQSSEKE